MRKILLMSLFTALVSIAFAGEWSKIEPFDPTADLESDGTLIKAANFGLGAVPLTVGGISFGTDTEGTNADDLANNTPEYYIGTDPDLQNLLNYSVVARTVTKTRNFIVDASNLEIGRTYRLQYLVGVPWYMAIDCYYSSGWLDYWWIGPEQPFLLTYTWEANAETRQIYLGLNWDTYPWESGDGEFDMLAYAFHDMTPPAAEDPVPFDGATVSTSLSTLSWTNPEPNEPGGTVTCDVYLGTTEPNEFLPDYGLDVLVEKGLTENYVTIPSDTLQNQQLYYWVVDCHVPSLLPGLTWTFYATEAPVFTSDPQDQAKFEGQTADFAATFVSDYAITEGPVWFKQAETGSDIEIDPDDPDITVTTTGVGNEYTSVLEIANLERSDAGAYYCQVTSSKGTSASQIAKLVIKGFIGYWPFEGNASDISGNELHGILNGSPIFEPGKIDTYALNFDGINDYVELPEGFEDFTSGLTFSVWAKPASAAYHAKFLDLGNGMGIDNILFGRQGDGTYLYFSVYQGSEMAYSVVAADAIALDQWQLFVVTMDEQGNVAIYRNGISLQTGVVGLPYVVERRFNYFGETSWQRQSFYHGLMDDVKMYNYALTADEVATMYSDVEGSFCREKPIYDFTDDCIVDLADFAIFAGTWLQCGLFPDCQ